MENIINIDVTEAEHKEPNPNKYLATDIRMELCEQFVILLSMFLLKYKVCFTIWLITFILTAIKTFKIWRGDKSESVL